jgi:hypothetical protein
MARAWRCDLECTSVLVSLQRSIYTGPSLRMGINVPCGLIRLLGLINATCFDQEKGVFAANSRPSTDRALKMCLSLTQLAI